jgi:hypothetical protein
MRSTEAFVQISIGVELAAIERDDGCPSGIPRLWAIGLATAASPPQPWSDNLHRSDIESTIAGKHSLC